MANYNSLKNAAITAPAANTDLGSPTNKYGNLYMSGNISLNGTSLNSTNAVTPRIASISYVGDDTAANPAGGAIITLTGSGFVGSSVYIGGTIAGSVSVVSSTQLTFVAPAKTAGSYSLSIVNSDGATAVFVPGMQYSGVPAWSTAAGSLGSVNTSASINFTVVATSDSTVSYSIYSGSLPSGASLNSSTGAITGTAPVVGSTTTYNFTIRATDSENQDTDRNFSMNVILPSISVQYLVVAGGGAGGTSAGGGGGGGGILSSNVTVTGGTYTITVGSGGSGSGINGSNSVISGSGLTTITSIGGGSGFYNDAAGYAKAGGAGGGGGFDAAGPGFNSGALGTAGQGNAGGRGENPAAGATPAGGTGSNLAGGGGGGGGYNSYAVGNGGAGGTYTISGSSVTYAGGGGGGQYTAGNGSGGAGGGGAGGSASGVSGTANTGGGGGGGYGYPSGTGGAGGSGVVIIRYADTSPAAASTTGSPTITVAGGYRVYKFTSSGSITF